MTTFQVADMSCGHCVQAITLALKAGDPDAKVSIDLPSHLVNISDAKLGPSELGALIAEAGYTPVLSNAGA